MSKSAEIARAQPGATQPAPTRPDHPAGAAFIEVWLMNADTGAAVSLGVPAPDGQAALPVPTTLKIIDYPYVDLSQEPLDGNPQHSGTTIA